MGWRALRGRSPYRGRRGNLLTRTLKSLLSFRYQSPEWEIVQNLSPRFSSENYVLAWRNRRAEQLAITPLILYGMGMPGLVLLLAFEGVQTWLAAAPPWVLALTRAAAIVVPLTLVAFSLWWLPRIEALWRSLWDEAHPDGSHATREFSGKFRESQRPML